MSQIKIENGDLYIIFKDGQYDVLVSYKLDNGAEFDFDGDEPVQLILPNFEAQLNRGSLANVPIELLDVIFEDTKIILPIKIINDTITISLDCSSIIRKL